MPKNSNTQVDEITATAPRRLLPTQAIDALDLFIAQHSPHAVLSFDVFDTLIWRKCARPSDAFRLMVNKGFGRGVLAAERRIAAELIASRFHQHPNLEQIMSFFPFGWTAQEEIAFEASLLTPNPFFLKWISKAPRDIPILYISDMYLSEQTVHAFLVSLGFPAKKNNVFTSATRGCSKRDHGSLFKLALQTIDHHGMAHHCHIGDHWQADIHNAPPDSHTLWLHTPSSWHTSTRGPFFNAHLDVRTHIAQDALRHLANDPHLP